MNFQLLMSLILFGLSIFAIGVLMASNWIIRNNFGTQEQTVYVNVKDLLATRMLINVCTTILLLLECATLIWDSLTTEQFPQMFRWPIDLVVVILLGYGGLKLFVLYAEKIKIVSVGNPSISDPPDSQ